MLEKEIVTLGLSLRPEILLQDKVKSLISQRGLLKLLAALEDFLLKNHKFDLKEFNLTLPEQLQRNLADLVLASTQTQPVDVMKDLSNSYHELLILKVKQSQQKLTEQISKFEKAKDKINLKIAKEEYTKQNSLLSRVMSSAFKAESELKIE
jgi:hypothetical protein